MNDAQLRRSLNSIGKACFVSYFPQFCDKLLSNEDLIDLLVRQENYSEAACRTRVSQARRIIASGRAVEALLYVAGSIRVSPEVSEAAKRFARNLQRHTLNASTLLELQLTTFSSVSQLESEWMDLFTQLAELQKRIREKVSFYADGKNLKGNELVGWLGEIYGKVLFNGKLVSDSEEHDFVTDDGWRVSVKTRKGWKSGWKQTSAIPNIDGSNCPTHLLFVHLNDNYSIDRMWLIEWHLLLNAGRFKEHIVRGSRRSFIFAIDEEKDRAHVVYSKPNALNRG